MALTRSEYSARVQAARALVAETLRTTTGNSLQRRAAVMRALRDNFPDVPVWEADPPRGKSDETTKPLPRGYEHWGAFARRQYAKRQSL